MVAQLGAFCHDLQVKPTSIVPTPFWWFQLVVGKDAGQGWQIADLTIDRPEQPPDRVDVLRHRIEIAHQASRAVRRAIVL